mmetsp:Transcript_53434/g.116041  ORF Transcript_53434/g.116041 Transcript_53434/m.116041 type:complete len:319 (-) Transcript_53434:300-1256(-)
MLFFTLLSDITLHSTLACIRGDYEGGAFSNAATLARAASRCASALSLSAVSSRSWRRSWAMSSSRERMRELSSRCCPGERSGDTRDRDRRLSPRRSSSAWARMGRCCSSDRPTCPIAPITPPCGWPLHDSSPVAAEALRSQRCWRRGTMGATWVAVVGSADATVTTSVASTSALPCAVSCSCMRATRRSRLEHSGATSDSSSLDASLFSTLSSATSCLSRCSTTSARIAPGPSGPGVTAERETVWRGGVRRGDEVSRDGVDNGGAVSLGLSLVERWATCASNAAFAARSAASSRCSAAWADASVSNLRCSASLAETRS